MKKRIFIFSRPQSVQQRELSIPGKILMFFLIVILPGLGGTAAAREPIRFGGVYALTGQAARGNASSIEGARFAVDEINKNGGLLGRKVELLVFDNHSSPIGSKKAAEAAVAADVAGIIGSNWSVHSKAVAQVAQANHVPQISCISTHPAVTRVGDYIFRACFTDPFQGEVMARFAAKELKVEKALVLKDLASDYSISLASVFSREFKKIGGQITDEHGYKHRQERYDSLLREIKARNPEVIFLAGHSESGVFAKWARRLGLDTTFLGGDGWTAGAFLDMGGRQMKKGYFCTHWHPDVDSEISRNYVISHPGVNLTASHALAYDATMLMAAAIRNAGSLDGAAIRDALAHIKNFVGVTGPISFDEFGDPIKKAVILEIDDGRVHFLKTVAPE